MWWGTTENRMSAELMKEASQLSRGLLIAAVVLPAIYLLVMVQFSAITYPFWDHVELLEDLARFRDGSLSWLDLVARHNETRPLVYRIVYLLNAQITDWDIRSEYVILNITLYSTFLLHVILIRRIVSGFDAALVTAAVASAIYFSPVGHNNFWWSMMFQLDVANLFMFASVVILSIRPVSWFWNIVAAILGWLAAYTLTNGIFLFIAAAVVAQLAQPTLRRISRHSLFWAVNLIVLLAVYLPGIPLGHERPSVSHFLVFVLTYLGTPLAGLIWYPYRAQFDLPVTVWWPALVGAGIVIVSIAALWRARKHLAEHDAAAIALYLCAIIAAVSAAATAWGRAEKFGIAEANSSRYSIFAAYLLFGLIYFCVGSPSNVELRKWVSSCRPLPRAAIGAACVVIFGMAYFNGVKVFQSSHEFNRELGRAYALDETALPFERLIYPQPNYVRWAKAQLLRLALGPYRNTPTDSVSLFGKRRATLLPLSPGVTIAEEISAPAGMLFGLSVHLVANGTKVFSYPISWEVDIDAGGGKQKLASGEIAGTIADGTKDLPIPLTTFSRDTTLQVRLSVASGRVVTSPIGVDLYEPAVPNRVTALPDNTAQGVLAITLRYVRH